MKDLEPMLEKAEVLGDYLENEYISWLCPNEDIMP